MKALVLKQRGELRLREIDLPLAVGAGGVKIQTDTVGVCGSDVHYYTHGRIGSSVVEAPMVLGHEAAGTVVKVGSAVSDLKASDRVGMEPGCRTRPRMPRSSASTTSIPPCASGRRRRSTAS